MKEFIVTNFEKVLLTTLLLALATCSVIQILGMEKEEIDVLNDERKGSMVSKNVIPEIEDTKVALIENSFQPYDARGYIYCRKSDCQYLILSTEDKCPWCKTETKPVVIVKSGGDEDNDGIPDEVEIKLNLAKDDASDATLDLDDDGFSNIDEHKLGTALNDADEHPSVINRVRYRGQKPKYYPIRVATIETGKYDPKNKDQLHKETWDIYVDVYVKGRWRSRYYRINDSDKDVGYAISNLGVDENGKPWVDLKKGEEDPVRFYEGKNLKVQSVNYFFTNELDGRTFPVQKGQEFFLVDKNGNKEKYKLDSFDLSKKEALVTDYQESEKVKVGMEVKLQAPGAKNDGPEGFEDELELRGLE